MNEFTLRHYSGDEVNRIIRRALKFKQDDTISHQDLVETAQDIGIDSTLLETAILQEQQGLKKQKIREARLKRRRVGFYSHLWSYIMGIAVLLLINHFTPGPWWFQWPLLGWGIGLAFHCKAVFFHAGKNGGLQKFDAANS
jgi:hypothetical protein